jgi:hypothetical protein
MHHTDSLKHDLNIQLTKTCFMLLNIRLTLKNKHELIMEFKTEKSRLRWKSVDQFTGLRATRVGRVPKLAKSREISMPVLPLPTTSTFWFLKLCPLR